MIHTRKGKIARMPRMIREEVNRRLLDGEEGKRLLVWLNGLPEVRQMLEADFGGKPVSEQNLSEWRQGGHREWVNLQEARAAADRLGREAADWDAEGGRSLTEVLAAWAAARLVVETRRVDEAEAGERWQLLREMTAEIVELRRGEISAQRLALERGRAAAAECEAERRWKRRIVHGLEARNAFVEGNPEAKAKLDELAALAPHPFDPTERAEEERE